MVKKRLLLTWKMFFVYLLVIIIGTLILTAKNVWVNQSSIADLKKFFFGAIAFFNVIFLLIMQGITHIRLRQVYAFFYRGNSDISTEQVFVRLLRFPSELFWSMIVVSLVFSVLFHIAEIVTKVGIHGLIKIEEIMQRLDNLLSEMALAVTLAVMVYSLMRITLKPYVKKLRKVSIGSHIKRTSIAKPFLLAYVSCFIVISFDVFRYVVVSYNTADALSSSSLIKIVTVDILFSFIVFFVLIWELRSELHSVEEDMRSLVLGDRMDLHKPISIRFADEIGWLTESFNAIQNKMVLRYQRLDEELNLAYAVQQMLLPEPMFRHGDLFLKAVGSSADTVQNWYDYMPIADGRIAVTVGAVSGKGMPAALAASTAMFVLRSIVPECKEPYTALSRTKAQLHATLPQHMDVHIGLAFFDSFSERLTYAGDEVIGIEIHPSILNELTLEKEPIRSLELQLLPKTQIILGENPALKPYVVMEYKN